MAEFTKEEKQICLAVMRGLMAEEPEIDAGYINRAVFANAHEAKKGEKRKSAQYGPH